MTRKVNKYYLMNRKTKRWERTFYKDYKSMKKKGYKTKKVFDYEDNYRR